MAPVKPSDFEKLIVKPEDTFADGLMKVMRSFILFWRNYTYMFDAFGGITAEFEADLCAIGCGQEDEEEET